MFKVKTEDEQNDIVDPSFTTEECSADFRINQFLQTENSSFDSSQITATRPSPQILGHGGPLNAVASTEGGSNVPFSVLRDTSTKASLSADSSRHTQSPLQSVYTTNITHFVSAVNSGSVIASQHSSASTPVSLYPVSASSYNCPPTHVSTISPFYAKQNYFSRTGNTTMPQTQEPSQTLGGDVYEDSTHSESEDCFSPDGMPKLTDSVELVTLLRQRLAESRAKETKLRKKLIDIEAHVLQVSTDLLRKENENKVLRDRLQRIEATRQHQGRQQSIIRDTLDKQISSMKRCIDELTNLQADNMPIELQVDCEDIGKEDQTERRKQPSNTCDENVSQETVELGAAGEVATSLVQDVTTDHIENPWRQRKRKRIPPGTEGDQLKTVDTRKEKVLL